MSESVLSETAAETQFFAAYQAVLLAARPVRQLVQHPEQVPVQALEPMRAFNLKAAAFVALLPSTSQAQAWRVYLHEHLCRAEKVFAGAVDLLEAYQCFGYLHNGIVDAFDAVTG